MLTKEELDALKGKSPDECLGSVAEMRGARVYGFMSAGGIPADGASEEIVRAAKADLLALAGVSSWLDFCAVHNNRGGF